jgi:hypothetical protein
LKELGGGLKMFFELKNQRNQLEKAYFLYFSFLASPLALHFKDDL